MSIVVGVDGSEYARAALLWALEEAQLRGTDVVAMHVYAPPGSYLPHGHAPGGWEESATEAIRRGADEVLQQEVDAVEHEARRGEVPVKKIALEDRQPARALTEHAGPGDLLVVGSRGHGALATVLLGSVSHRCIQLARCPVVVLHEHA